MIPCATTGETKKMGAPLNRGAKQQESENLDRRARSHLPIPRPFRWEQPRIRWTRAREARHGYAAIHLPCEARDPPGFLRNANFGGLPAFQKSDRNRQVQGN